MLNSTEHTSTKISLLALAEFANADGGGAIPGFPAIAAMTSLNERTCRRAFEDANGRWFTREPIKLQGKDWRAYSYKLTMPEGAGTTPAGRREGAGTVSGANDTRCGHSDVKVRTLTPEGAGTVSAVLGRAPRKKHLGEKSAPLLTYQEWKAEVRDNDGQMIPDDDPIFEFVEAAGISDEFHLLAWTAFKQRFQNSSDRCADWRERYRRAVREDWFKLWRKDLVTGEFELTTAGEYMRSLVETNP